MIALTIDSIDDMIKKADDLSQSITNMRMRYHIIATRSVVKKCENTWNRLNREHKNKK